MVVRRPAVDRDWPRAEPLLRTFGGVQRGVVAMIGATSVQFLEASGQVPPGTEHSVHCRSLVGSVAGRAHDLAACAVASGTVCHVTNSPQDACCIALSSHARPS